MIHDEGLLKRADAIGVRLRERLQAASRRNDLAPIANVRGPGAMVAFDLVKSRGTSEPDGDMTRKVTARALENGLVLLSCGIFGETIRILVPLTASDTLIEEGLDKLEAALRDHLTMKLKDATLLRSDAYVDGALACGGVGRAIRRPQSGDAGSPRRSRRYGRSRRQQSHRSGGARVSGLARQDGEGARRLLCANGSSSSWRTRKTWRA